MGTKVKHIFLLGMIAALCNAAGCFDPSPKDLNLNEIPLEEFAFSSISSGVCPLINLPGQISLTSFGCKEESDRRTDKGRKQIQILEKSGKPVSDHAGQISLKKEIVINISITEHIHKLIYLGKLII